MIPAVPIKDADAFFGNVCTTAPAVIKPACIVGAIGAEAGVDLVFQVIPAIRSHHTPSYQLIYFPFTRLRQCLFPYIVMYLCTVRYPVNIRAYMLQKLNIFFKKIRRIPASKLSMRVRLGIRKYLTRYPYSICLQTVSACNLKCKHCFINDYNVHIHDGLVKIMKFDEFLQFRERLRPMIRHAAFFQFSTFEAIMNKNLFRMMDSILEINPGIKFPFLSNTMLLNSENIRQLEQYPVSEINISLDGYTKKTVEDFKTEVLFEKIVDTIRELKSSSLGDRVAVTFVAHRKNIAELPEYVDFVHRLGVRQIYVSNLLTFTTDLQGQELYTQQGNADAEALFGEAVRRARKNGQHISMPRLKPDAMGCQASETFFIDITGNISPCDFLAVSTPFTLWGQTLRNPPLLYGNIFKSEPLAIYRNIEFEKFRNAHRLGKNIPKQCTHCIDAYGLMCSNRIHHAPAAV
jgi:MoaA/NifB/PqqE/SkfB family radical SAM enzyme